MCDPTLQVLHKRAPCGGRERSLFLTAVENTWIHGRQKRREGVRQLRELPRAPQRHLGHPAASQSSRDQGQDHDQKQGQHQGQDQGAQNNPAPALEAAGQQQQQQLDHQPGGTALSDQTASVEAPNEAAESGAKVEDSEREEPQGGASDPPTQPPASPSQVQHFLFKCLLNVIPEEEGDLLIEMHWVEGHNKDLMNQLCTYLKNVLLKSVSKCWTVVVRRQMFFVGFFFFLKRSFITCKSLLTVEAQHHVIVSPTLMTL